MKKRLLQLLAICLAVILLLPGCDMDGSYDGDQDSLLSSSYTKYADMKYTHPDMTIFDQVLEESCAIAETEENFEKVLDNIYKFYDVYDWFYTSYDLAYLSYCKDMRDIYWKGEYEYCAQHASKVDAGLETLYRSLAKSPVRSALEHADYFGPGFFQAYEGERTYDEGFVELMSREAEILSRYYDASGEYTGGDPVAFYDSHGERLGQIYVELVALRQEIAAYCGYPGYPEFAYDFYHSRGYDPDQALQYAGWIQQELVPLYRDLNADGELSALVTDCTADEMLEYVKTVTGNMGGEVSKAFDMMAKAGLYDVEYSEHKFDSSYELFIDAYYEPFIFLNPTGTCQDKLTLVHEFGHFAHDFVCYGTYAGTDVAETLSQGMEYLSLCYGVDTEALTTLKMADSLCVYVEQAAYTTFEHGVYALPAEELTVENVQALYAQTAEQFGFDPEQWDPREYILVPHFFTNPVYIISYVVSNDAALQLYQREMKEVGSGLQIYNNMLSSMDSDFMYFVEEMGLEDPMSLQRVQEVRETMEKVLG